MTSKPIAERNRTLTLSADEIAFAQTICTQNETYLANNEIQALLDNTGILNMDCNDALQNIPVNSIDLAFIDPPYNMNKKFGSESFSECSTKEYSDYVDSWLEPIVRLLKPNASIYICGDWKSSRAIEIALEKKFIIQNRITWEREKGRGSKKNWKNASEDIWYATRGEDFYFSSDSVKLQKTVRTPYRDEDGKPKDWDEESGERLTYASNLWTDITVPFWSMSENTPHPTQKPEKLLARILLASSKPGDLILDPFSGSGTSAATCKKLDRYCIAIEKDPIYCAYAVKRVLQAKENKTIQGYVNGIFCARNSHIKRKR